MENIFFSKYIKNNKNVISILGIKIKYKMSPRQICENFEATQSKIYRTKYENIIYKIKEAAKTRKIRVCFLVSEPEKWNAQNIYEQLEQSNIFEPIVIVTNLMNREMRHDYESILNFFKSCVKNVEIGWDNKTEQGIDIKKFKPDIVFYQQPWELYDNQNVEYVSEFALTSYFSYAIEDASDAISYKLDNFLLKLWKYIVFSKETKKQYYTDLGYKTDNISICGHPKLDIFKDYNEENYKHEYIIYAPHHSFSKSKLKYGTFQWNGKKILDWAKKHSEYTWVFKPHPQFKKSIVKNNIMTENELNTYINEWKNLGLVYEDGNYFDLFKNSKCLITDCGSFLTEYLLTKQPVIHLRNKNSKPFTVTNRKICETYYPVFDIHELNAILEDVIIKGNDYKKSLRNSIIQELNINKIDASSNIIAMLENIIK